MGPTPEPLPDSSLDDEERPNLPPIFLSSSEDEEEEQGNPEYPPGYLPIVHYEIHWDSDEEAIPASSATGARSVPGSELNGVADGAECDEGDGIDYSNLAGLMSALNTHGVNQVEDPCGLENVYASDEEDVPVAIRSTTARTSLAPLRTASNCDQSKKEEESLTSEDRLPLPPEQEEAVLQAMRGFSLPPTAVPEWAHGLPDSALSDVVRSKLQVKSSFND